MTVKPLVPGENAATALYLDADPVLANGVVQLRFLKLNLAIDGTTILAAQPHRTTLTPGAYPNRMLDSVDRHLEQMGFPKISDADRATIIAMVEDAWSPEVIEAFQAAQRDPANPGG